MKIRLSIVQFARDKLNKEKNISRMTSLLKRIENTDIVCLPEMWMGAAILDEDETKGIISSLREIAVRNNYCLLTGGLLIKRDEKIFSTCHVIKENTETKKDRNKEDRNSEAEGFYDKRFPSAAIGEREYISSGNSSGVFEVCGIKIGIAICVDAMYPEVIRELATGGALIIFNPSNIPEKRTELWKHISCARAAENTVFFVFANNTNTTYPDGRNVTGGSLIVSPEGEIILQAGKDEEILNIELNTADVDKIRQRWKYLKDIIQKISPKEIF